MKDPAETFPARLISARERKGMSKSDLARALRVSPTSVWNWEAGRSYPRYAKLKAISILLDVSFDQLQFGANISEEVRAKKAAVNVRRRLMLTDAITEARLLVSGAAGVSPEKVSITIEY